jgi:hypothetical protein
MAYKSTGRPVGRPKTKEYRTISLKIPTTLLDQVKRYAKQRQQSVSELFREGVEWRIGEGDPLTQRYATGDSAEQEYLSNTEIPIWIDRERESVGVLAEIRTALASQATQLQALTQALEQRPVVPTPSEYYGNTTKVSTGQQSTPEPVRKGNGGSGQVPQDTQENRGNTVLQDQNRQAALPPYDTSKYVLGVKLCPGKHDYQGTGKTLLTLNGRKCPQCQTDGQRARREARRQAQPA